jgi:hypothetical protein
VPSSSSSSSSSSPPPPPPTTTTHHHIPTGGTDAWSRIPKKPGGAAANKKGGKAKGGRVEASLLGFTTKSPLELLAEDD